MKINRHFICLPFFLFDFPFYVLRKTRYFKVNEGVEFEMENFMFLKGESDDNKNW